jgi:transcriptional regulator with XRE-family HTH domain
MPIADRVKQLRTEAGLSQAEFAELVGGSDARQISPATSTAASHPPSTSPSASPKRSTSPSTT